MTRLWEVLAKMPSTNARIAMTLLLALGTGIKYWAHTSWEPAIPWLAFLVTMAGLDVAQFHSKRATFKTPKEMTS